MARLIELTGAKTYKTYANAVKAVEVTCFGSDAYAHLRYFIYREESTGRYFPVFIGMQALQDQIHFRFHVVA